MDDYAKRKNVHFIFYEDLHEVIYLIKKNSLKLNKTKIKFKKPFQVIKSLSEFLDKDLSEKQINSIIQWCSFENMKQNPAVNYEWYKTLGLYKKDGHFFRKGKIGDWLNHFTREDSIELDNIVAKNLKLKQNFNYGISEQDLNKIYSFKKD